MPTIAIVIRSPNMSPRFRSTPKRMRTPALELIKPVPNTGEAVEVAPGIRASFRIAGHILGSSLVLVEIDDAGRRWPGRRVLFSGDLGHYDQPIIRDPVPPPSCDYLLVESTYGDRLHDPEDPKSCARTNNQRCRATQGVRY